MEDEVVELRLLTTILVRPFAAEAMVHTIAIIAVVAKFVTTTVKEWSSSANNDYDT